LLQEQAAFAVLPGDLPYAGRARVLALGKKGAAEVLECRVMQPLVGKRFLSCTVALLGERVSFSLQSVASFHAENAAAAGLLARIAGVSAKEIAAALEGFCVPGRACCVSDASAPPVLTDSGYLPSHLEKLLRTLRPLTTGRLCVLLGSVGGRAYARRAALGRVAATYADFVYLTADDPDTEDVCAICAQMQEGIAERERTLVIPQREAAIRRAVCELRPGDVLLLFGKGGLDFQLIGGERAPLDEPGEVLAALSCL
jgi:UDP-N-acetylmuramoyl-L-alanyl-D-glutamate--2,6-diaminopimelate ligase